MAREKEIFFCVLCSVVLFSLSLPAAAHAKQERKSASQIERSDVSRTTVAVPGCGDEMELDRRSGKVVRKNRVDLIVSEVELIRTNSGGVAIKATVKNRCPGEVGKNVHVSIDDVVVTIGPPAPNGSVQSGAVVLGAKPSYSVTADYDNRISEVNESNNRCVATFPATLSSKRHRCP